MYDSPDASPMAGAMPLREEDASPGPRRGAHRGSLILGALLLEQRLVDVRDDAAARDGRLDERVELLVTTDGELQVARRDTLDAQVLGRVTRELEHLRARGGRGRGSDHPRAGGT